MRKKKILMIISFFDLIELVIGGNIYWDGEYRMRIGRKYDRLI